MNTQSNQPQIKSTIDVYILKCTDGSYFIGHSQNILKALKDHMAGKMEVYTSRRLPVKLEYIMSFDDLDKALVHKKQLQGWSRSKKAAFIEEGYEGIRRVRLEEQKKKNLLTH